MELNYDIVAVDDDTLEHEIMTRALRKTSYRIKCFDNPTEALAFLAAHHTRYLFVDYRMPSLDGVDFINQLASVIDIANIDIYLTSGSEVPQDVSTQATELGAQFILKDELSAKGYLENLCDQGSTN